MKTGPRTTEYHSVVLNEHKRLLSPKAARFDAPAFAALRAQGMLGIQFTGTTDGASVVARRDEPH